MFIPQRQTIELREGLESLIKSIATYHPFRMVEVGSYAGESAAIFLPYVDVIYCVDEWSPHYNPSDPAARLADGMKDAEKAFDEFAEPYHWNNYETQTKKVFKFKAASALCAVDLLIGDLFDFVYIDANHSEEHIREDITLWSKRVKPGGWVGGHDYSIWSDVGRVVREIFPDGVKLFADDSWLVMNRKR